MDDASFDRLIRALSTGTPRRQIVASALTTVMAFQAGEVASAKGKRRKCKKSHKKCGKTCIPKSQCCTNDECGSGQSCNGGACVCTPQCAGKSCGPDGCGGSCGQCASGAQCDGNGRCPGCTRTCSGKSCGPDGCGGTCGTCTSPEVCNGDGQCVIPCNAPCSPGQCCPTDLTCQDGLCRACPATPNPCAVEVVCGRTTAQSPLCFCVTSVDAVTTCTSVFVNPNQTTNCTSDDDCTGLFGFGVDTVCVDAPCLNLGISKVCMNVGCEDLMAPRARASSESLAPELRQAVFPAQR